VLSAPHSLATLYTGHNFISISTTSFDKYVMAEIIRKEEFGLVIELHILAPGYFGSLCRTHISEVCAVDDSHHTK
jgi:hypothetical protein